VRVRLLCWRRSRARRTRRWAEWSTEQLGRTCGRGCLIDLTPSRRYHFLPELRAPVEAARVVLAALPDNALARDLRRSV
jgi:hypothetical protein